MARKTGEVDAFKQPSGGLKPEVALHTALDDLRLDTKEGFADLADRLRALEAAIPRRKHAVFLTQVNASLGRGQLVFSLHGGAGILNSFTLVSPAQDFGITFIVDGQRWLDDRAFADLVTISPHVQNIAARALPNGTYALSIYGVPFLESVRLLIGRLANGPQTFPVVAANADVEDGVATHPPPGLA